MSSVRWLQKRGRRIARTIFASLSFETRLSYAFAVLSGTELQALGRALGVIFIKKKVTGLPDIHGKPALEFPVEQLEAARKDPTRLLPTGYLSDMAAQVRQHLLYKYGNEQLVDTAISSFLFHFVVEGGWKHMTEGVSLSQARSYVTFSVTNVVRTELKSQHRQRNDSNKTDSLDVVVVVDDDGNKLREPSDPKSEAEFFHNIPINELPKVRSELAHKVHPDAPLYLDLLLEGYTAVEILGFKGRECMLPHLKEQGLKAPYQTWKLHIEPRIRETLLRFMRNEGARPGAPRFDAH